jgi:aryl-alcohol dehydrogenase-like predicted oxidoreductase
MEDGEVNNSPEHIAEYIEGTIKRLGSTPDLYYLHRIDPKQDLEASITALDKLKKDGKTRYIGLSECNAQTLRKACSCISTFYIYHVKLIPRCPHRRPSD